MCERCANYKRCFERRGRCREFRETDYERIREELQTAMQSVKIAEAKGAESGKEAGNDRSEVYHP